MRRKALIAALYMRLSRSDLLDGESNSIVNQRRLLVRTAKELGFTKIEEYIDDGYSGTNFDRPSFVKMESDITAGKISAVIVKDLSRLGRDYLKVGYYTTLFFPENSIRLIAIDDGFDSDKGEDDFIPFRNIMNEWHSKDISRKIRASYTARSFARVPFGRPPYGYMVDSKHKEHWIIDQEAADVVRKVYALFLGGEGIAQIAHTLSSEKILTPKNYSKLKAGQTSSSANNEGHDSCAWAQSTIGKILSTREYCGDIVHYKTDSRVKKKRGAKARDEVVFEGVHEPIINRKDWERVQELRGKARRRSAASHKNIFTGLLVCSDCGSNLHFHAKVGRPDLAYYTCSKRNNSSDVCNSTHSIRIDNLEKLILGDINRVIQFADADEDKFAESLRESIESEAREDEAAAKRKMKLLTARSNELDTLWTALYEDRTLGIISDERFLKLRATFEAEQAEIVEDIAECRKLIDADATINFDPIEEFVELIGEHAEIKELSADVLHRFIDKVCVFHAEQKHGKNCQRVDIYYRGVGKIEIPTDTC